MWARGRAPHPGARGELEAGPAGALLGLGAAGPGWGGTGDVGSWAVGRAGTDRPISALTAPTGCGFWVKSFEPFTEGEESPTLGVFYHI